MMSSSNSGNQSEKDESIYLVMERPEMEDAFRALHPGLVFCTYAWGADPNARHDFDRVVFLGRFWLSRNHQHFLDEILPKLPVRVLVEFHLDFN